VHPLSQFKDFAKRLLEFAVEEGRGLIREIVRAEYTSLRDQLTGQHAYDAVAAHGDQFGAEFDKDSVGLIHGLKLAGGFLFDAFNPNGSRAWQDAILCPNMVVNAALNDVLAVYLNGGTPKTLWYLGLIDNTGFSALAAGDTMSSHSGWSESIAYTQGVRQTWTPSAPSGQTITNPTSATFTINATVTIKGAFLVSDSTKGGSSGTLFATGPFASNQSLVNGQNLKVSYSCPATAT
jgi:hypothetical protein